MSAAAGPSGFIVIDKPSGITSFDVIRELRRSLKIKKLGHSGVLDKPATGVLVIGANKATRLFELFSAFEKTYTAEIWLGLSTTTDDLTGELRSVGGGKLPDQAGLEAALGEYTGTIDQIPPAFSLTKLGGKELYRYALAGEEVEVKPKRVTVLGSRLLDYTAGLDLKDALEGDAKLHDSLGEVPQVARARVELRCVGGVYVRSIARDVGADLGTEGTLGQLTRNSVGPFSEDEALSLDDVARHMSGGGTADELLRPLSSVAPDERSLELDATQLAMVRNGQSIRRFKHHLPPGAEKRGDIVFGLDPGRDLAVVLKVAGVNQHSLVELRPHKVIG
jgi:tRNA pseudouridine55 synthase